MVFKLFSQHQRHTPTTQWAGVQNLWKGSHPIAQWQYDHPAPSPACTRAEKKSGSIGMVAEDRYKTTLNESSWMIRRGNLKIGNGCKYNNIYPLMVISLDGVMNIAESRDTNLWHGRLGHMWKTDPKSTLSPLRDSTTPPRADPLRYMRVDAREITMWFLVLYHLCR